MIRKTGGLAIAGVLAAFAGHTAQAQATIDWAAAETAFEENRASGNTPPRGKGAARCAGYWVTHVGALTRGEFPQAALDVLDPELTSKDEAGLNAIVFSQRFTDVRDYTEAKAEAEALLPRVVSGEGNAIRDYFRQLGRCSAGPA